MGGVIRKGVELCGRPLVHSAAYSIVYKTVEEKAGYGSKQCKYNPMSFKRIFRSV